jgi:hypothetical protein
MRNLALRAALALGVFFVPMAAQAENPVQKRLQECTKQPMPSSCKKDVEKVQKALEDVLKGKKSSDLPIGDLGKLLK